MLLKKLLVFMSVAVLGAYGNGEQPLSNVQIYPDMDYDGIQVVVPGCTDPEALNYEPNATEDDGSCVYPPEGSTDAIVQNIQFTTGCDPILGPWYSVQFTVKNNGDVPIETYCVDLWVPDASWCYDSNDNVIYQIPPGEVQTFSTSQFYTDWFENQFFVIDVNTVNDEVVTGNNNTTVFMPELPLCDPNEGCTDVCAINYDPNADLDDGSCEYEIQIDTVYIEIEVPVYITDTVYVTEYDTVEIEIEVPVYITDTVYVTEYDTVEIEIEVPIYITDTVEIEVIEYVYLTDTITEYIPVDCETGEPCIEDPSGIDCWPWTVYIPNTFTPNNDGFNDVWQMIYDLNCWVDVEFRIYNRWGVEIYHGYGDDYDSYPYWNGSVNNGSSYVADGVYTYTFYARHWDSPEVYYRTGHITVFR